MERRVLMVTNCYDHCCQMSTTRIKLIMLRMRMNLSMISTILMIVVCSFTQQLTNATRYHDQSCSQQSCFTIVDRKILQRNNNILKKGEHYHNLPLFHHCNNIHMDMIKQKKQQDTDADCSSLSTTTQMQPFYFPYHDRSHYDNDQQLKRIRKGNEHRILNDRLYQTTSRTVLYNSKYQQHQQPDEGNEVPEEKEQEVNQQQQQGDRDVTNTKIIIQNNKEIEKTIPTTTATTMSSTNGFTNIPSFLSSSSLSLRNKKKYIMFTFLMFLCGGLLGPFLDTYHSAFGVLTYDQPITFPPSLLDSLSDSVSSSPLFVLITTYWVPPLFGLAGMIIGWLYILFDKILVVQQRLPPPPPQYDSDVTDTTTTTDTTTSFVKQVTVPQILYGISLFTFQYWLSGYLYAHQYDRIDLFVIMSIVSSIGFFIFDNTLSGCIVSTLTALGGPCIEYFLLSYFASIATTAIITTTTPTPTLLYGYHYNDIVENGYFPTWIVPVYFLGGPAVGNLARGIWNSPFLNSKNQNHNVLLPIDNNNSTSTSESDLKQLPGCKDCNDTRIVPCPNCDGIGTYVAMGGQSIQCTSCRGRGYVICRSCFHSYNDIDPYDIESIRQFLSKLPD